jgi:hypothetical protein
MVAHKGHSDLLTGVLSPFPLQVYAQIKDQTAMAAVVTEYLSDFNAISKKPMHLIVFQVRKHHVPLPRYVLVYRI